LRETVKSIVRLGFLTEETTESIGAEAVGGTTLSINISNVDLNGSMILGGDETVGGRANNKKNTQFNETILFFFSTRR
jgi:hypothetical protein